ncbi:DUF1003 domain-containing protein [Ornithinimicrobium sp. W1679]|uniref:DUF1003 domain-containing protein n=1 Tax=Ornithinimicrobium sp. W1679 TaxID=3418770 RepID=UPI003CF39AA5
MSEPLRRDRGGERSAGRPADRLDQPLAKAGRWRLPSRMDPESFGAFAERFARFMGTARFLVWMTVFVAVWVVWNTIGPPSVRFDPYAFIFLTLMLSLQASYAAPLILLATNRQDDRDKVQMEQDRARDERNLADTEFLTREVAALRLAMREVATRDFVRSELRSLLEELVDRDGRTDGDWPGGDGPGTGAPRRDA